MKRKLIFLLIVIGIIVYFGSLFNGFVWDDEEVFVNNPNIRSIKNIPLFFSGKQHGVGGELINTSSYYRPIVPTISTLVFSLSRGSPLPFRLFQVAIHIACAVIVFLLFFHFFKKNIAVSFLLAAIFLVHPVNSEAVLFNSANQEILFVLVGISALLLLTNKKILETKDLLLTALMLITSLLIKETGVIFFVLFFFYLIFFNNKELKKYFILASLLLWFYLLLRLIAGSTYVQGAGLFPIMRVSIRERLMTTPLIILFYLKKFIFPKELAIARHWVVFSPGLENFFIPALIDGIVFLSLGLYALKTRNKIFAFFYIWFLMGLLPHLQIVPLNMTVAERWFYLPIIGLLGMIGSAIAKFKIQNLKFKIIVIAIIILLSTRTFIRTFDWRNDLTLFSHDAKISQPSFDLENNLGVVLFRAGNAKDAKSHFKKSVELASYWWVNWNNLGVIHEKESNLKIAEQNYKQSMKNGDYYLAYENYVKILIRQNRQGEAKEFLETTALKKFPNNPVLNELYLRLY